MSTVPLRVVPLPSFYDRVEPPKSWPARERQRFADGHWSAGRLLERLDGRQVAPGCLGVSGLQRPRSERQVEPPKPLGALLGAVQDFRPFRFVPGLDDPDPEGHACLVRLPKARFEILALATEVPDLRLIALRRDGEGRLAGDLTRLGREAGLLAAILAGGRAL